MVTDRIFLDTFEGILVAHVTKLEQPNDTPYRVGLQFFQSSSLIAAEALSRLEKEPYRSACTSADAVIWDGAAQSTRSLTADGIVKVVLDAVVRRLLHKPQVVIDA